MLNIGACTSTALKVPLTEGDEAASSRVSFVAMMQSADLGNRDDATFLWGLHTSWRGRAFLQREMRARSALAAKIGPSRQQVHRHCFGKQFNFNNTRLEGTLDVFNLFNANHVLLYNEVIGTSSATAFTPAAAFLRPTRILTPRIVRFGVTVRF